jgi:hypothetical protein
LPLICPDCGDGEHRRQCERWEHWPSAIFNSAANIPARVVSATFVTFRAEKIVTAATKKC